ncbi:MAG: hypothetical protein PCFJNLEI_03828 [Verrucomicrobiae bacterium]|nr:hypothetical protein [Verrucomicrobiae bacterium]
MVNHVAIFRGAPSYEDATAIQSLVNSAVDALRLPADFIRPGDRVVLKPNWVKEHNLRRPDDEQSWLTVVTHPAVILEVARWAARRLQGRGAITICDAPQSDSSFDKIRAYCQLDKLRERCVREFPGITFQVLDLRSEGWIARDGVPVARTQLPGDPAGVVNIHLDENSEFIGYRGQGRLYGAAYDFAVTNRQHCDPRHEYLFSRTPLAADVLINLPKLKTHKKVGLTVALKNMIGTTARTNWLPRHTEGTPAQGGDQFADSTGKLKIESVVMGEIKRILKDRHRLARLFVPLKKLGRLYFGDTETTVRSGNWHGNDTCWRMILDLTKCLVHYDGTGERRQQPLRYLVVVDGIIAGEGDGPMACDPRPCGVIMAGTHPVAVDCVAATLMGFDWRKTKLLRNAFEITRLPIVDFSAADIQVVSNQSGWTGRMEDMKDCFEFRPHFGWAGHLETDERLARTRA